MRAASQSTVQVSDPSFETAQSELSQLRAQLQKAQAAAGRSSTQNGGRAQVCAQTQHTKCPFPRLPGLSRWVECIKELPSTAMLAWSCPVEHCGAWEALLC